MVTTAVSRTVTFWLFEDFEVLDVFGPLELFAHVPSWKVELVGPTAGGSVRSAQKAEVLTPLGHEDVANRLEGIDILLVPGGIGRLDIVKDDSSLRLLRQVAVRAATLASVCTGSGILAAAGCIDDRRATTNKRAWDWARAQSCRVEWVPEARWVVDGSLWSASGVAAGMDMTHALISREAGEVVADTVADAIELEVHRDPSWDPFARIHGVI